MKNVLVLALVAVATLSSCRKDYVCECKSPDQKIQLENLKKSEAEDACALANTGRQSTGGSCTLVD